MRRNEVKGLMIDMEGKIRENSTYVRRQKEKLIEENEMLSFFLFLLSTFLVFSPVLTYIWNWDTYFYALPFLLLITVSWECGLKKERLELKEDLRNHNEYYDRVFKTFRYW